MSINQNPSAERKVIPSPLSHVPDSYFFEAWHKAVSESIKFYSSPHRASTYHTPELDISKLGEQRNHLVLSYVGFWNINSPKLSRNEFEFLISNWDIYKDYRKYAFREDIKEIRKPEFKDSEDQKKLFIEFTNHLEIDWLFYRSYFKVFHDESEERTKLNIDLAAYCYTHHFRYLMRKLFGYLEGNYVVSLRREAKVYIPHIQFGEGSVELLYTSALGLDLEQAAADYFIKENINSVDDLLDQFEKIINLKVDVGKEEKEHIFLNVSEYIDRNKFINMYKDWIESLRVKNINFRDRQSIISNLNIDALKIPDDMFLWDKIKAKNNEDTYNFESDLKYYCKNKNRAKRLLLRSLINDFIQHSLNRYRFEERKGLIGIEERSEYENIFRSYENMTFLEKYVGCLLVECGEISFITMIWRYIENPDILNNTDRLLYWGLIEKQNDKYTISPRAERMAKWCMKLIGLKYVNGENKIDYFEKDKIGRYYSDLTKEGSIFSWMKKLKSKEKLSQLLGKIIFNESKFFNEQEIIDNFKELVKQFYDLQDNFIQKEIKDSIDRSRFQKSINEFNRAYETINRTAISFPISTIPTEVETKVRAFSIFIGSFNLDDRLDSDDQEEFENGRRELADILNYAKIFYTSLGKPASESASEAVMQSHARRHLEYTLGRYQHKVKNEGVYLVARMDKLWKEVEDKKEFEGIKNDILEMKKGIERFSGTIHILNIATNGFQRKYLENFPYCIIDVITDAYCNAFQQFYTAGKKEELEKLWSGETKSYLIPLFNIKINFEKNGSRKNDSNVITYMPHIENIKLHIPSNAPNIISHYFDAENITQKELIADFVDPLPQRIILQSPFFEVFTNAFTYMSKQKDEIQIEVRITKNIQDTDKELVIEVINPIDKDFKIDRERIKNSAGIAANQLFFENIGGRFVLDFDELNRKAIARTTINFKEMENIIERREKSNGVTK